MKISSIFLVFAILLGIVVAGPMPGGDSSSYSSSERHSESHSGSDESMEDFYEYNLECEYYEYDDASGASGPYSSKSMS